MSLSDEAITEHKICSQKVSVIIFNAPRSRSYTPLHSSASSSSLSLVPWRRRHQHRRRHHMITRILIVMIIMIFTNIMVVSKNAPTDTIVPLSENAQRWTQRRLETRRTSAFNGRLPRHRPSRYAAFGRKVKWTTSRHCPSVKLKLWPAYNPKWDKHTPW